MHTYIVRGLFHKFSLLLLPSFLLFLHFDVRFDLAAFACQEGTCQCSEQFLITLLDFQLSFCRLIIWTHKNVLFILINFSIRRYKMLQFMLWKCLFKQIIIYCVECHKISFEKLKYLMYIGCILFDFAWRCRDVEIKY